MRSFFVFNTHTNTPAPTAGDDSDKYHRTRVRSDGYNPIFSLFTLGVLRAKASGNGECQIRIVTHDIRLHTSQHSMLLLPYLMMYYTVSVLFLLFVWCPCMAINVSVQYNGGLLPGILLLPQCYYCTIGEPV